MRWGSVDLSKMIVAAAQYAGPLGSYLRRFPCIKISDLSCRAAAVIRDEKKMSLVTAGSLRPTLNIYGCSGILLASIPVIISFCAVLSTLIRRALQWKSGRLIEMGWSEDEKLICVLDDGTIQIYSVQGRLLQTFSMGAEFREDRVLHCCIWGGGVVCLSRGFCLAYIDNLEEPTVRKMPRLTDLSSNPTCMAIIEPQFTQSKALEVLVAVEKTILLVDMTSVQDQKLTAGPLRRMSVCPNGKMLACFTHDGFVWVITTDFSKNLSEFPTKSLVPPHQAAQRAAPLLLRGAQRPAHHRGAHPTAGREKGCDTSLAPRRLPSPGGGR